MRSKCNCYPFLYLFLISCFIFICNFNQLLNAQGCSDAGFCTIGPIKADNKSLSAKNENGHRISFLTSIGQGDEDVLVATPALQYDYYTKSGWNFQGKITANYANGSLSTEFDAGDIFLGVSRTRKLNSGWIVTPTLSLKIPLNASNLSSSGMPLPMQYQSSLGTFDAIVAITFSDKNWQFSAGYQQPLSGENKNGFLPEFWNGKPEANNYPPTFRFKRKGDILLRGSRHFTAGDNFSINAGLLGIYHLGEDEYTNPFEGNLIVPINGSDGITLNVTMGAYWQAGSRTRLGITGGVPLVVRDVRPDGLTRSWVIAPEISWSF
jgi:hypothetical protein